VSLWHRLEQLLADDETEPGEGAGEGQAPELDLPAGTSGGAGTPGELLPPRAPFEAAPAASSADEVEPGEVEYVGAPERTPPPPPPASSGLPVVIGSTPQPLSGAAAPKAAALAPSSAPVIVAEHPQPVSLAYPVGPPPEVAASWEQPSSQAAHTMANKHIRNRHRGHR
jgi:hypothetical protein